MPDRAPHCRPPYDEEVGQGSRQRHEFEGVAVAPDVAGCAIRVSFGWESTESDVDGFVAAWCGLARRHGLAAA